MEMRGGLTGVKAVGTLLGSVDLAGEAGLTSCCTGMNDGGTTGAGSYDMVW